MARDPATGGYWEVASDGGIFTFDAPFLGSMGNKHLNQPIVRHRCGSGWQWLLGGGLRRRDLHLRPGRHVLRLDRRHPPRPAHHRHWPTPSGAGYWLTAADGGVFAFGTAPFYGSLPGSGVVVRNITAVAGAP